MIINDSMGRWYSVYMSINMARDVHRGMQRDFLKDNLIYGTVGYVVKNLATYYAISYVGTLLAIAVAAALPLGRINYDVAPLFAYE